MAHIKFTVKARSFVFVSEIDTIIHAEFSRYPFYAHINIESVILKIVEEFQSTQKVLRVPENSGRLFMQSVFSRSLSQTSRK